MALAIACRRAWRGALRLFPLDARPSVVARTCRPASRPLTAGAAASPGATAPSAEGTAQGRDVLHTILVAFVPLVLLGVSLGMWPLFDLLVLPWAFRRSIEAPKFASDSDPECGRDGATAAATRLRELLHVRAGNAGAGGRLVILRGAGASVVARHVARGVEGRPCAYVDLGECLLRNPYELFAFQHLGMLGNFFNAYAKAAIFVGSVLAQRHPHVDALMFYSDVFGNFRTAVEGLQADGLRPVVILDNVDFPARIAACETGEHTRTFGQLMCLNLVQQASSFAEQGIADVMLVASAEHSSLYGYASAGAWSRALTLDVVDVRGKRDVVLKQGRW